VTRHARRDRRDAPRWRWSASPVWAKPLPPGVAVAKARLRCAPPRGCPQILLL
jgi:hypothetical protein